MTARRATHVIAVLDANVLYPAPLRDFFMWQAANGVFAARWTDEISKEALSPHGIEAVNPDEFGLLLLERFRETVIQSAVEHWLSLRNPPKNRDQYLASLRRAGLEKTAGRLVGHL